MLIDLDIVEANIAKMAAFAERSGLRLRPHIKTHKSLVMAQRQLTAGAAGLCVATVSEAEVFAGLAGAGLAGAGLADTGLAGTGLTGTGLTGTGLADTGLANLTLAYPVVGERKLSRLAAVCQAASVTLVADSAAVVDGYREVARQSGRTLAVLAEVDTGMRRVGVPPQAVPELARQIAASAGLEFAGILTHAGHAHDAVSQLGIERVARQEAAVMGDVRADLERAGHEVRVVSAGASLTSWYLTAADGITEIRPGTYIYNDLRTLACWSCTPDEIAATMLATVVSTGDGGTHDGSAHDGSAHDGSADGTRVTVDAGSKTLTATTDPEYGSGHLAGLPDTAFTRLSEEHGVLAVTGPPGLTVGQRVRILPVHVCVWSDLQPEIYGLRRGEIVERIRVNAMRHSL